jgi:hypothetical protein
MSGIAVAHVVWIEDKGRKHDAVCACSWKWPGWLSHTGALEAAQRHAELGAAGAFDAPTDQLAGLPVVASR